MTAVSKKVTINCVSLNQDQDVFAFGTNEGFMVYCADPFAKRFERKIPGGVGIIELLFRSNILAFVGTGINKEYSLQKLHIWDDNQNKTIAEFDFESPILNVKLRRDKIVIILERITYIYNLSKLSLINRITTTDNPYGLGLVSSCERCVVGYLSDRIGEVLVATIPTPRRDGAAGDANCFVTPLVLSGHKNEIRAICFSQKAKYIAVASKIGTKIPIYETTSGKQLLTLIRGKSKAEIYSMNFSSDLKYFVLTASSGTMHIFFIDLPKEDADILPEDKPNELRSFCRISVSKTVHTFASFSPLETRHVISVGEDGSYEKYSFDEDGKHKGKFIQVVSTNFDEAAK